MNIVSMKLRRYGFLIAFAAGILGVGAGGFTQTAPELVGTWNYTSLTVLKKGKPFGTAHFKPGQWTVTFNQDATWVMKASFIYAMSGGLKNGSYAVHGHDVDMKLANDSPYQKYSFTIEQDGKVLTLTAKEETISASREQ